MLTYHIVGIGEDGLGEPHVLGLVRVLLVGPGRVALLAGGGRPAPAPAPAPARAPVPVRVIVRAEVLVRLAVGQQAATGYNVDFNTGTK